MRIRNYAAAALVGGLCCLFAGCRSAADPREEDAARYRAIAEKLDAGGSSYRIMNPRYVLEGADKVSVQLLNTSDEVVKETSTDNGRAEFFYVKPGTYYARMFVDSNRNGLWDTGDYAAGRQPETTYYYPEKLECKEKWDMTLTWNPTSRKLYNQKPMEITKQKPEKEKTIKRRNFERAQKLGIPYPSL